MVARTKLNKITINSKKYSLLFVRLKFNPFQDPSPQSFYGDLEWGMYIGTLSKTPGADETPIIGYWRKNNNF